jgi:sirohydrochlorin ferrochelatase
MIGVEVDLIGQAFWVGKSFIRVEAIGLMHVPTAVFLCDNGSLRPAATLGLRRAAAALAKRLGQPVLPVSLLHSSGIDAARLDGRPADLLEPAVGAALARGVPSVVVLPFFFGPSAALTEYIPARLGALLHGGGRGEIRLAASLVRLDRPEDDRVGQVLAQRVRGLRRDRGWSAGPVVLVDHGSPQPAVGAVRDRVAEQVARLLGEPVWPSSMESREGVEYAFNRPLLADRLRAAPCDAGRVVVLQQFLGPGRHAGVGGDLDVICREAERERPGLEVAMTEPVGEDPGITEILADRYREALESLPLTAAPLP